MQIAAAAAVRVTVLFAFWVRWRIGVGIRYEIREGVKGYAGKGRGLFTCGCM